MQLRSAEAWLGFRDSTVVFIGRAVNQPRAQLAAGIADKHFAPTTRGAIVIVCPRPYRRLLALLKLFFFVGSGPEPTLHHSEGLPPSFRPVL